MQNAGELPSQERIESRIDVDERIFAYKHLGVIYASNSNTQTRAESYFIRLLDLSPEIEIVDMYVSKKISDFFSEVKQDYKIQKTYSSNYDEFGREVNGTNGPNAASGRPHRVGDSPRPAPDPKGNENSQKQGTSSWVWWTAGLVTATGIGIGAYLSQPGSDPQTGFRSDSTSHLVPQP